MGIFEGSLSRKNQVEFAKNLKAYQYVSPSASIMERLFLNDFWHWFVTCLPMWLAPNAVTVIGFTHELVGWSLLVYMDPTFGGGDHATWVYILFAVCQFIYQTCDGADGKQARRIKAGSPLGELFDHGLDSLIVGMMNPACMAMIGIPVISLPSFIWSVFTVFAFYFSNLTLLHVGRQKFFDFDAQEIQVVCQCGYVATGFLGKGIWRTVVPMPTLVMDHVPSFLAPYFASDGCPVGLLLVLLLSFGPINNCIESVIYIIKNAEKCPEKDRDSEGRGMSALVQQVYTIIVYGVLYVSAGLCLTKYTVIDGGVVVPFCVLQALAFTDIMAHLLVTRVTKLPFPTLVRCRGLWFQFMFFITCAVPLYYEIDSDIAYAVRAALAGGILLSTMQYAYIMGWEMSAVLDINIFTIKHLKSAD